MPRLTNKDYLHIHHKLREAWLNNQKVFSYLTPQDQCSLHSYFIPDTDLTAEDLLAHRKRITTSQPSLPHRAGRALSRRVSIPIAVPTDRRTSRRQSKQLLISGIVRPEPNLELLATAFIQLAQDKPARRSDDRAA